MKASVNNIKERTFITHLHETKVDKSQFSSDFKQKKDKKADDKPKKAKKKFRGDKEQN